MVVPRASVQYNHSMPRQPLASCVRAASLAARQAGALLARYAGKPASVKTKRSPVDLVTEVDGAAERLIRRALLRATPGFGFLGEESGGPSTRATASPARPASVPGRAGRGPLLRVIPSERSPSQLFGISSSEGRLHPEPSEGRSESRNDGPGQSPYRWIVDPLDGTMNFVHGLPLFGVSIGLEARGTLVAGVIYDPMRNELFTATAGGGAFLNGRRMRVSSTRRLAQSLLSTGFSSAFRASSRAYLRWFRTFEASSHAVRRIGSTALCLAYVAAGRLDGFYEQDLWPWDIAAGILLVREAGGRVSNFHGRPVTLEEGRLVASNRRIHGEMLRVLRRTVRAR